jgi:CrcB protein
LRELLIVGAGGFLGAISRYWLSGWVHRWAGIGFPWGTLAVNTVGCLAIGALMALLETRVFVSPETRLFLGIGILGSLTTFSTFGYETLELARRSEFSLAAANAAGSLLLGLGAVVVGRVLVRWMVA